MKELIINGVDYSEFCPEGGCAVQYKKVLGKASGVMLDGTEVEDLIKSKAVLTVTFLPMDGETQSKLLKNLRANRYAQVRYFDPEENDYREIEAIWSEPKTQFLFRDIYERDMWKINPITFRER